MQEKSVSCLSPLGFHSMAYTEWGKDGGAPPIVCVHALTRNGRDFDALAAALATRRRVVCPDIVGRGKSDWLTDASLYGYPQYLNDLTTLIGRLDARALDWVGTSMGGILGMLIAATPNAPVRRLVVNDVGPFIPLAALQRIGAYANRIHEFATLQELEHYLRQTYASFGIERDADWRKMAEISARNLPNGRLTLAYDPSIGKSLAAPDRDVSFWEVYDRIRCPVLVLRGAQSDILSRETAEEMSVRGPRATLVEWEGVGHAPALLDERHIEVVTNFLEN